MVHAICQMPGPLILKAAFVAVLSGICGVRGALRSGAAVWAALALMLAPASSSAAELAAEQWLARMQQALVEVDYAGEFSYFRDGELSSLAIVHARIQGVQRERLVHLDGPHREILRTGEQVTCVLRDGDPMLDYVERMPAGPFARAFIPGDAGGPDGGFGMVPASYAAQVVGAGRVAGEATVVVDIRPDDLTRYGYRLWLHEASAMPLRAELVSADRGALEIFQFVRIELNAELSNDDFEPAWRADLVRHDLVFEADAATEQAAPVWEATWLPNGFAMAAAALRPMPNRPDPLHTLRYSDGLASLSVFIEPVRDGARWSERKARGATTAVMHELETPAGDRYLVTVVGEVPMATAERVAAAVRPRS